MNADVLPLQDLGPDLCEGSLERGAGRDPGLPRISAEGVQGGRRRRSSFPLGVSGRFGGGTNVVGTMWSGSFFPSKASQFVGGWGRFGVRNIVGGKLFVVWPRLPDDDHALPAGGMPGQDGLDFAQFDPKPANLDLVIDAAQEFEIPIGSPAAPIAGAVQAGLGSIAEGVGNEALGCSSGRFR